MAEDPPANATLQEFLTPTRGAQRARELAEREELFPPTQPTQPAEGATAAAAAAAAARAAGLGAAATPMDEEKGPLMDVSGLAEALRSKRLADSSDNDSDSGSRKRRQAAMSGRTPLYDTVDEGSLWERIEEIEKKVDAQARWEHRHAETTARAVSASQLVISGWPDSATPADREEATRRHFVNTLGLQDKDLRDVETRTGAGWVARVTTATFRNPNCATSAIARQVKWTKGGERWVTAQRTLFVTRPRTPKEREQERFGHLLTKVWGERAGERVKKRWNVDRWTFLLGTDLIAELEADLNLFRLYTRTPQLRDVAIEAAAKFEGFDDIVFEAMVVEDTAMHAESAEKQSAAASTTAPPTATPTAQASTAQASTAQAPTAQSMTGAPLPPPDAWAAAASRNKQPQTWPPTHPQQQAAKQHQPVPQSRGKREKELGKDKGKGKSGKKDRVTFGFSRGGVGGKVSLGL